MCRREFFLTGIIQGVGFRPFVYRLATSLGLSGYVQNSSEGVQIFVEGEREIIEKFRSALTDSLPPLARIDSIDETDLPPLFCTGFEIKASDSGSKKRTFLPPDIALCDACLRDMNEPKSRFYRYPFTTCTDCGPRYTIIRTVPYDRPNTSMAPFALCPECRSDYNDPSNRRYHAQPLACPSCGPKVTFKVGNTVIAEGKKAIDMMAKLIQSGKTGAVKGMGGFHLVCDAASEKAVQLLRTRKKRPAKPFAVMFGDLDQALDHLPLGDKEKQLLASKERPILLIDKPKTSRLAEGIAPGIDRLGILLAYTPLHHLLFGRLSTPIVATSANISDAPIAKDLREVIAQMGSVVDGILDFDREIVNACDDSIVQPVGSGHLTLRLGRGYAPKNMKLPFHSGKKILAVGAHQKNSIAVVMEDNLILGPHIGNLNTLESFGYFEKTLSTLKSFYDFEPDLIVCDRHPGYQTTRWAKAQQLPVTQVQHHHAHLLACMAEFGLNEPVLGFAFDGTGYGDDGHVWGSEVMTLTGLGGYERRYRFASFGLLGGDLAVREPRRCALALLFEHFDLDTILSMENPTATSFSKAQIHNLHVAWKRGLNTPRTTSAGRLFDAAASLAGLIQESSYEGESGLLLEAACNPEMKEPYPFEVREGEILLGAVLESILHDIEEGRQDEIPSKFINTVAAVVTHIAGLHPELPVVLGGGVFQNRTLLEKVTEHFDKSGRRHYFQQATPINDGSIALGQAYLAAWLNRV